MSLRQRARAKYRDDDDESGDEDKDEDEDYVANVDVEDDDIEQDDDSDYEDDKPKKKAKARTPRISTRATRASRASYKEDSDEEEYDFDDDDDDDVPKKRRSTAAAAAPRSQRQAAQQANRRLKVSYKEDDDEDDLSGGSDAAGDDDDDADDNGEDGYGDDEDYARQLDREMNGPRTTRGGPRATRGAGSSGPTSPAGRAARHGRRDSHRTSRRTVAKVSYVESEDDDSDVSGSARRASKLRQEPLPAFEEGENFDDEVERVLAHREMAGAVPDPSDPWATRELFIKWKRYSYIHCSWDSKATLSLLGGYKRVINYMRKADELEAARPHISREEQELRDVERQMEEQLNQQHSQVERVFAQKPNDSGSGFKYLVKWEGLPYSEVTWETEEEIIMAGGQAQVEAFLQREARLQEPHRSHDAQRKIFKQQSTRAMQKQPDFLEFGQLRDYQLDGLNWMVYSWSQDRNVILADEMGLGKTVQCVSFLGYLTEQMSIRGPFLVVVPLSTVPNWIREFRRWTPTMNVVVYVGDSRSREAIRAFEFDVDRRTAAAAASAENCIPRQCRFEVLITTYELILKDAPILSRIKWSYLVVDEAHRLKNAESALYQELITFNFMNKLLVTGTPLQNSLRELWALLHFLEPEKFPCNETFEQEYSLQTMDGVSGLHTVLRPHLLRRVIKEVEKSLPPKNERILRVEMTPLQRQYYKWILTRNFKELNKGARGGGHVSLLNIICELKKCCNHPFLFESAEEGYRGTEGDRSVVDRLIVTSGKLVLLDKLLRRLKETGHRVLIFSQMVRVLDIVSDYMRLRGFQHQRLDGSTPAAARHQAMEQFNRPDSTDFAFLLSTRAGGLGINLATADTVVIFDSDWNPQNDLQAMSRAHRIGQTETVNIYRLVTSGSVEEDILERAKKKMVLDHLVIQRMDTSGRMVLDPGAGNVQAKQMFGKDELAAILRFGAEELFKQEAMANNVDEVAEKERKMYEEDIDAILERAEVVDSRHDYANANAQGAEDPAAGAGGDLLSSFNVATFKNDEDDATFWSRLIPTISRPKEEEEDLLPRAARLRLPEEDSPGGRGRGALGARAQRREQRANSRKVSGSEPGPPVDGAILRIDEWLLDVDEQGTLLKDAQDPDAEVNVKTISRRDANAFVRAVRRFGLTTRISEICSEAGSKAFDDATPGQRLALFHTLLDYCRRAVDMAGEDPKDAILDFFGAAVKAQELVQHYSHMRYLERCVEPVAGSPSAFKLGPECQMPTPKWGRAVNWGPRDDAMLLMGVYLYGLGHWDKVAADERLRLGDKLASVVAAASKGKGGAKEEGEVAEDAAADEKGLLPKASHMETRVLGLLRKMHAAKKAKQTKLLPVKRGPPPGGMSLAKAAAARQQRRDGAGAAADGSAPGASGRGADGQGSSAASVGAKRGRQREAAALRSEAGRAGDHRDREPSHREHPRDRDREHRERDRDHPHRDEKRPRAEEARDERRPGRSDAGTSSSISSKEAGELLSECTSDIKALRKLQRHAGELGAAECAARTKELLASIGRTIDKVVARRGEGLALPLWEQVGKVTEGGMSGSRLQGIYAKIKAAKAQGAAAAAPGAAAGQAQGRPRPSSEAAPSRQQQQHHSSKPREEEQGHPRDPSHHHHHSSSFGRPRESQPPSSSGRTSRDQEAGHSRQLPGGSGSGRPSDQAAGHEQRHASAGSHHQGSGGQYHHGQRDGQQQQQQPAPPSAPPLMKHKQLGRMGSM